jgi:transcription initiation factor TFIIIB Brf1 subunit/transcription initiation factor TFIIB
MPKHKNDEIIIRSKMSAFRKRNGVPVLNDTGRVTLGTFVNCSVQQRGRGYLYSVKNYKANKNVSVAQTVRFLKKFSDDDIIVEVYPVRFCCNKRCEKASWFFLDFENRGHSTCGKCGMVNKLVQNNMDSRHLNDDEKVNKNQWNCTPGMDVNDTVLINKNGKRLQQGSQRIKSHQRHYWSCRTIIDSIADTWHFAAAEYMATRAKAKCKKFYYSVHTNVQDDNPQQKMPHGQAQFAAACFYASVLEFEHMRRIKTTCTLSAIRESANWDVNFKRGRKTRSVTVEVIIRYVRLLKEHGLCQAPIPEITADTLSFQSKYTTKEHARLAIFNKCQRAIIHLPSDKPWGMSVGDTEDGVLYVENVIGNSEAFKAGLKKGDYFFQIENDVIGVEYTPITFGQRVVQQKRLDKLHVKLSIMREKK